MRVWIIAAAAALTAGGAALAGGRMVSTPQEFHGVTVLSEWRIASRGDSSAAHTEMMVGPYAADAVVFLTVDGSTVIGDGEADVRVSVAAKQDGQPFFSRSFSSSEPSTGAATVTGGSRLFLRKGESALVQLDVTRSGGDPEEANASAELRGLAIATP